MSPITRKRLADGSEIEILGKAGVFGRTRSIGTLQKHLAALYRQHTLARDAQVLVGQGYRLKRAGILDMFPQTAHVEAMALFEVG